MPWNGTGTFSRNYSWVSDKNNGINITASRMDADTNDIVNNGLNNCITRDGQGVPSANLPMAGFRHTGAQNAVNAQDYVTLAQLQNNINYATVGGSADAITLTLSPAATSQPAGTLVWFIATANNATATPTAKLNALAPMTIQNNGQALAAEDIEAGKLYGLLSTGTVWDLIPTGLPSRDPWVVYAASTALRALAYTG